MALEPISAAILEERGLFRFDYAALSEVHAFVGETAANESLAFSRDVVSDALALTAAEFALTAWIVDPQPMLPRTVPIVVDSSWTALALMKTNCQTLDWCTSAGVDGRSLADVTAFSADVTKLTTMDFAYLHPHDALADVHGTIGEVARVVDELEHAHRQSQSSLARRVGESGVLRLQGFLWAVKLTLGHASLEQVITDAYAAFELSEPVSGQVVG